MAYKLFSRKVTLFHAKKQEIPGTSRGIGRNFVNREVLGMNLAQSTCSGVVGGKPGEGFADKQIRERVRRCVLHRGEYIGCSPVRRCRHGRTAVEQVEETSDESGWPEVIGSSCLAEQSGDGDPG